MVKSITLFILFFSLGIIVPIYFDRFLLIISSNTGIGWVLTTIIIRLIVVISFIFAFKYLFSIFELTKRIKIWMTVITGTIIGFLIGFAISPIYETDYGLANDGVKLKNIENLSTACGGTFSFEPTTSLIAFFTTNCPFCKSACQKLGHNSTVGQTLKVDLFFPGNRSDTDRFLENNSGTQFNSHLISDDSLFMEYAGYNFPSIFVINGKGETIYHWKGDEMNYSALDYLLELEQ